jgi:hypothetical protein
VLLQLAPLLALKRLSTEAVDNPVDRLWMTAANALSMGIHDRSALFYPAHQSI